MKKIFIVLIVFLISIGLSGCNDNNTKENNNYNKQEGEKTSNASNTKNSINENKKTEEKGISKEGKKESYLNYFSTKEIEYARIWYQLRVSNYNVDPTMPIYINKIAKGSKVNPQAKDSAVYKEDVTTIASSHSAIGSITYSSNGDGTINLYKNVPYKWESPQVSDYSHMAEVTKKVIEENIETIYVEPSDNQDVGEVAQNIQYTN
ncbi:hypothetical protein NGC05_02555 [Staphylococcus succinus]|uniref:hypothetical protein n=1 Tax=Staphylococcus succinus TaxID=61015 RepID=UPI002DB7D329|nr:hypothetical protein [Staphylococcus succinus]MEB7461557.1 hypothetical protein [Staphylococcus succinus]